MILFMRPVLVDAVQLLELREQFDHLQNYLIRRELYRPKVLAEGGFPELLSRRLDEARVLTPCGRHPPIEGLVVRGLLEGVRFWIHLLCLLIAFVFCPVLVQREVHSDEFSKSRSDAAQIGLLKHRRETKVLRGLKVG